MRRFLGLLSLGQVFAAAGLGLWAMAESSTVAAVGYGALLALAPFVVTFVYCAKCPCRRGGCAHVLPGLLARLFRREPGPYRGWELAVTLVVLAGICLAPLVWLVGRWLLLALYVALVATAVVEIRATLCRGCDNDRCPLRR